MNSCKELYTPCIYIWIFQTLVVNAEQTVVKEEVKKEDIIKEELSEDPLTYVEVGISVKQEDIKTVKGESAEA